MKLRIREICNEKGITQKDLAARLGVHEMTIGRASKGVTSLELLEKIANELNVPIAHLFEGSSGTTIICPHCGKEIKIKAEI